MKTILFFICLPIFVSSQLKVEWKEELTGNYTGVSGLICLGGKIYITQTGDQVGSAFNIFSTSGTELFRSTTFARIRSFFTWNNALYSMGDQQLTQRSINGEIISEYTLPWKNGENISSSNGAIINGKAYSYAFGDFLKHSLNGEQVFRKEVAKLCNSQQLKAAGKYVYLYSIISDPALGARLMQYDTLGNQNWSIAPGIFVINMIADDRGNTYLVGGAGGKCYVQKYNKEGNQVWSSYTEGISYLGGVVHGDSLFVCGGVTTEKPYDEIVDDDRKSAWAIYSVQTGERIYSQTFNMYAGEGYPERFRQIAFDQNTGNVYLGGAYGQEGNGAVCILVKLSKEGNTTGLNELTGKRSFTIFPNPSGSKFTINCSELSAASLKVTVRNSLGQVVHKDTLNCNDKKSYELDLGKQAAGNYTVEIMSGDQKTVKKVVVE